MRKKIETKSSDQWPRTFERGGGGIQPKSSVCGGKKFFVEVEKNFFKRKKLVEKNFLSRKRSLRLESTSVLSSFCPKNIVISKKRSSL